MNNDFVERLNLAFEGGSMAEVARRLRIPHATVRNYYQGRLPAPEVLIKIANATCVSLNWLLTGSGNMYADQNPPIGLGKFIEDKINELIDRKLELRAGGVVDDFDLESAVLRLDDPQLVMGEWFRHDGRTYPTDYGVVFFKGWETFSAAEKISALRDAKRVLDRSI